MTAVLEPKRLRWGGFELASVHDGLFRLDGGAMFGVVPRTMWEAHAPPDERNRIQLAMRPLVVEADWGRMIVDCGAGDKMSAKQRDIYALDRAVHLDHALTSVGIHPDNIDLVLATHLHWDHFAGAPVTSSARPSGMTRRTRTSATTPATSRTTSCR